LLMGPMQRKLRRGGPRTQRLVNAPNSARARHCTRKLAAKANAAGRGRGTGLRSSPPAHAVIDARPSSTAMPRILSA